jgi:MFS family permease
VLADRVGRRVTLLASLVLGAGCMLALGFAATLPRIIAAVLALSLTADMARPTLWAIVADVVEPRYRLKAFGYLYWCFNLGFTLAALVAGFMAARNFTLLFVGDAATTLVMAALVFAAVPETRPGTAEEAAQGSLLTPLRDRRFLPFLLLNLPITFMFFQHLTALPEDMRLKGLSAADFGMAIAVNGLLIVLFQPAMTKFLKETPRWRILAAASLLTGLGFGMNAWARTLAQFALAVAVWTLAEIILVPVNASIVADLSPVNMRGRYQSAWGLSWSAAMLVAPTVGPLIIGHTGMAAFWLLCLAVGLVTAGLHFFVTRPVLAGFADSR